MNTKLITALRTSSTAIENGTFTYSWADPARCNCGILACSLMGASPRKMAEQLKDMAKDDRGNCTWTHHASRSCPITGIPEHKLFKELFSHGLTQADFHHLEYLTDKKIRSRMQMDSYTYPRTFIQWLLNRPAQIKVEEINYKNGQHVARYMRAWAELLVEEGEDDVAPIRTGNVATAGA